MSMIGYKMLYTDLRSIWYRYQYALDTIHTEPGLPVVYTRGFHFYDTANAIPGLDDYLKGTGGFVLAKIEALGDIVYETRQIPPSFNTYRVYATNKIRIIGIQSADLRTEMFSYYESDMLYKKFAVADYVQDTKRNISMFYPGFADHFLHRPEEYAFDDESYRRKATYPNVLYLDASDISDWDIEEETRTAISVGHPDQLTEEQLEEHIEINGVLLPNWNDPPIPPEPPVIIEDILKIIKDDGTQVVGENQSSGIRRFTITSPGEYTVSGGLASYYAKGAQIYVTCDDVTLIMTKLYIDNSNYYTTEGIIHYDDMVTKGAIIAGGQVSLRLGYARDNQLIFAIGCRGNMDLSLSGYTGVIQIRDTQKCAYGIFTYGDIEIDSTIAIDITSEYTCIYGNSISCATSTSYMLKSSGEGCMYGHRSITLDSGSVIQITEAEKEAINTDGTFTMHGGNISISGVHSDGIRGEKIYIYDGKVNISTSYIDANVNHFIDHGTGIHNELSVNGNITTITVRINTGSHIPIHAGTRGMSYTIAGQSSTPINVNASGDLKITGGTITLDTTGTGISYIDQDTGKRIIYGAPSDCLVLNNGGEISGGTISLTSSAAGIHSFGSLNITKKAYITTYFANTALRGKGITLGTPSKTASNPFFAATTYEDCVYIATETDVYAFDDISMDTYKKVTTESATSAYFAMQEGLFTANSFIGSRQVTVTGRSGSISINRVGKGSVINSVGSIYFYTGLSYLYGMSDGTPTIKYGGKLVLGKGSVVMLFGSAITRPNTKNQPYIWGPITIPDGTAVDIKDTSEEKLASTILPRESNYLLVTTPDMEVMKTYGIYLNDEFSESLGAIT